MTPAHGAGKTTAFSRHKELCHKLLRARLTNPWALASGQSPSRVPGILEFENWPPNHSSFRLQWLPSAAAKPVGDESFQKSYFSLWMFEFRTSLEVVDLVDFLVACFISDRTRVQGLIFQVFAQAL